MEEEMACHSSKPVSSNVPWRERKSLMKRRKQYKPVQYVREFIGEEADDIF
jgi:hypothetical protein